ncbi:hypothetical protein D3C86_935940 [compost metagenome]
MIDADPAEGDQDEAEGPEQHEEAGVGVGWVDAAAHVEDQPGQRDPLQDGAQVSPAITRSVEADLREDQGLDDPEDGEESQALREIEARRPEPGDEERGAHRMGDDDRSGEQPHVEKEQDRRAKPAIKTAREPPRKLGRGGMADVFL